MLIVEKLHKVIEEAQTALELIESGKVRDSIKHLDEVKDSNFAATHLAWIMVKDEE
ncbi:hypothetical protein [Priestia filamentosa]|uniref:hypothetical protein n=1 Tax=Priestia filamentosa TaxID=1402861 RepID=UPI000A86AEBB|nr:hypothetical protein [Priestia filamentosa]